MKRVIKKNELDWELILFNKRRIVKLKQVLMVLFILIGFTGFSQMDDEMDSSRYEKVQQLKIAYFTKELALTSSEAEKFWPIYYEMDKKLIANRKETRKTMKDLNLRRDQMSDDEIKKKVNAILALETNETAIKKEYFEKIAGVIGYKKSAKLINLEQEFKRELLKRLNAQNNGGDTGPKPGSGKKPMK